MKIVLTKKVDKFLRKLHKSNPKMYNTLKIYSTTFTDQFRLYKNRDFYKAQNI